MWSNSEKTLVFFNTQLDLQECLVSTFIEANKNFGTLKKPLQIVHKTCPRLWRPLHGQAYNASLHKKIEKIQQNPTLVMTSVIRCTFK